MVDFNAPQTISQPRKDVLDILILQTRDAVIQSIGNYEQIKYANGSSNNLNNSKVNSKIKELWYNISAQFKRKKSKEEFNKIKELIFSKKVEDNIEAFEIINDWLDEQQITKFDTKKVYDTYNIEKENEVNDL